MCLAQAAVSERANLGVTFRSRSVGINTFSLSLVRYHRPVTTGPIMFSARFTVPPHLLSLTRDGERAHGSSDDLF